MKRLNVLGIAVLGLVLSGCSGARPELMSTRTVVDRCPSRPPLLAPIEQPPTFVTLEDLMRSHGRAIATIRQCRANMAAWTLAWGTCGSK